MTVRQPYWLSIPVTDGCQATGSRGEIHLTHNSAKSHTIKEQTLFFVQTLNYWITPNYNFQYSFYISGCMHIYIYIWYIYIFCMCAFIQHSHLIFSYDAQQRHIVHFWFIGICLYCILFRPFISYLNDGGISHLCEDLLPWEDTPCLIWSHSWTIRMERHA